MRMHDTRNPGTPEMKGRTKMIELKASSYKGKRIFDRATFYVGHTLSDVYDTYSDEMQAAYERCYSEFLETENHRWFSICSRNSFTCSWVGRKDDEKILRYETKDNSYLVWLER